MKKLIIILLVLLTCQVMESQAMWPRTHLESLRASWQTGVDNENIRSIIIEADKYLDVKPLSVMDKPKCAASGDKHDYLSQARYAWPDPTKPNGLPYIMRDGESNPELNLLDRIPLSTTTGRVNTLALAYYFTGDEKYADKAAELIRAWFLDPSTRMNPNLEYAQVFPGHDGDKGRSYGLIDSYSFVDLVNAVRLLEVSRSFTTSDSEALKEWFREFTQWMLTSKQGIEEDSNANNHSVAYDAQIIAYALYTGDKALAEKVIRAFPERRMYPQIEPDGSQPLELQRTRGFHYSWYNLTHFVDIMLMAKDMGLDISSETSPDGRNVYKAFDFLVPYIGKGKEAWPYQEIGDWNEVVRNLSMDLYRIGKYLNPDRQDYLKIYEDVKPARNNAFFKVVYEQESPVKSGAHGIKSAGGISGKKERLAEGWEFIRQDMSPWEVVRPVPGAGKPEAVPLWSIVSLPHCYNAEDCVDPDVNYYQGPAWYRTVINPVNPYKNGRILLDFEGAGQKTEVYIYDRKVGSHVGGYDGWTVDITDAVEDFRNDPVCRERYDGKVPVAVRTDNSRDTEIIPSDMSDFNLYGGLYRNVSLVYVPRIYIDNFNVTASLNPKMTQGIVTLDFDVRGDDMNSSAFPRYKIDGVILNPQGEALDIRPDKSMIWRVRKPELWSPSKPVLYTFEGRVVIDGDTVPLSRKFGFRSIEFKEKGPFYLNGQRVLLKGTHRHEDHAGVAAAMTDAMMVRDMMQIKDMGANFIRLGHYQQSDRILELCDSLGIMVWEEIPWCRGGLGGKSYKAQGKRMLRNMITRHRSHPSVILWGMGNENDWPGDFREFDKESIRAYMKELVDLSHELDPDRPTVIRRCDFAKDIVDVYSPTIWAGWYGGRFTDYAAMERRGFDGTDRFIHAEWGGDSHAGRHAEETKDSDGRSCFDIEAGDRNGDWSESYIVRLFDWHLKEQEKMPWLTGSAFWTFKDFSTPLRPRNPIPYVNQKGVVQRDNTPKESYYVFQSYWSDKPMVHIYGHGWPVRWGDEGESKQVLVYSNCPEAELFVNGKSRGRKKRNINDFPAAGYHWDVTLTPGENKIEAVGYNGKEKLTDAIVQTYQTEKWGKPAAINLRVEENDGKTYVCAELVDGNGVRCLDAADFIRFGCTDPDALVSEQGTATGSRFIQAANGVARIEVRRKGEAVSARDENGHKAIIQL